MPNPNANGLPDEAQRELDNFFKAVGGPEPLDPKLRITSHYIEVKPVEGKAVDEKEK